MREPSRCPAPHRSRSPAGAAHKRHPCAGGDGVCIELLDVHRRTALATFEEVSEAIKLSIRERLMLVENLHGAFPVVSVPVLRYQPRSAAAADGGCRSNLVRVVEAVFQHHSIDTPSKFRDFLSQY